MRRIAHALLLLACSMVPAAAWADTSRPADAATPDAVVQQQVDAYNRRDLEAFLSHYAPDARIVLHPGKVMYDGVAAMRAAYGPLFAESPGLRAEIDQRMVHGAFVVDRETVRGIPGQPVTTVLALYEVRDGRIVGVTFLP